MGKHGWTLVQHSGYGYAHHPGFELGVEERAVDNAKDRRAVESVGGVLFASYNAAAAAAASENYPGDYDGLYPSVRGRFAAKSLDGLAVYVPPEDKHVCAWCNDERGPLIRIQSDERSMWVCLRHMPFRIQSDLTK